MRAQLSTHASNALLVLNGNESCQGRPSYFGTAYYRLRELHERDDRRLLLICPPNIYNCGLCARNWACSVEPDKASVEAEPPVIVDMTSSK